MPPRRRRAPKDSEESSEDGVKENQTVKKTKTSKQSTEEQESLILACIQEKNKPVSATEIATYVQARGGVTPLKTFRSLLMDLAERNLIKEKVTKTTRIYAPIQTTEDSSYDLEEATQQIESLKEEASVLRESLKARADEIKKLEAEPSDKEIEEEIENLTIEIQAYKKQIERIKENGHKLDPKEKERLTKHLEKISREKIKRKRIFNGIVSQVVEGSEMSKHSLFEEAGIEI